MTDAMLFSLEYNLLVDYFTYDYRKIIKRERLFKYSAEGATTPETLRQKDRQNITLWKEINSHRWSKTLR